MTENVKSRLANLETPLRKSAGLAYAVRAFANSGELSKEAGNALDALATSLLDELTDITTSGSRSLPRSTREARHDAG